MTDYGQDFYDLITAGSIRSAQKLVPMVNDIVKPKSVLDIGGGNGVWLKQWLNAGVTDALCVDGDYVDTEKLAVPRDKFKSYDLTTPLKLGRKFDMAMSLEVAEHIETEFSKVFVQSLTRHADVIFFSAALPGQSGVHHINEQWASYWAKLFAAQGHKPYDILRGTIWNAKDIEPWYRQNCMLFATDAAAKRLRLKASDSPLDIVHPELFTYHLSLQKDEPLAASAAIKAEAKANPGLREALKRSAGPPLHRLNGAIRKFMDS